VFALLPGATITDSEISSVLLRTIDARLCALDARMHNVLVANLRCNRVTLPPLAADVQPSIVDETVQDLRECVVRAALATAGDGDAHTLLTALCCLDTADTLCNYVLPLLDRADVIENVWQVLRLILRTHAVDLSGLATAALINDGDDSVRARRLHNLIAQLAGRHSLSAHNNNGQATEQLHLFTLSTYESAEGLVGAKIR
jgi:hypothetical protein